MFHVMVILAGLAHFAGSLRAFEFTRSAAGVCFGYVMGVSYF